MKKILLISIAILLLVGCGKSDFDKCLDAESAKAVKAAQELLSPEQMELVNEILPELQKAHTLDPLSEKYWKANEELDEELESKGVTWGGEDWVSAKNAAKKNFPHAKELEPLNQAYDRFYELLYDDAFTLHLPNLENQINEFCAENLADDPYCLGQDDYISSILVETFVMPNPEPWAREICNSRGLYE